ESFLSLSVIYTSFYTEPFLLRLYRLYLVRKEKLNAKYVLYVLLILEALDLRVRKLLLIIDSALFFYPHSITIILPIIIRSTQFVSQATGLAIQSPFYWHFAI
ncbi:MAG: hypothetical protein ACTHVJ_05360, partial [Lactobacillus delbrueckii]